ncbi:hypothetical protein SAMN05519226_1355 [Cycloclasticus pugetii]|nr:hypothetical protein SAMN05519226_1355 [Cycloclasticus pugetii]
MIPVLFTKSEACRIFEGKKEQTITKAWELIRAKK